MAYNGYTDARREANARYIAKFAEVKVRMEPELQKEVKAFAAVHGESVNAFITRAIREAMERDTPTPCGTKGD